MTPAKYMIGIIVAAGIFVAGYMANRRPIPAASSASVKQALRYACPMHPQYGSDHPGDCPACGMRLELLPAGDAANRPYSATPDLSGTVQIAAGKQQLIGVRTDEVHRAPASHLLRVPGRISVDDARLYRIIAAADGWVRELGQNTAGSFVKRGQLLASYYTSNLLASTQTLLYAMATNEQAGQGYLGARTPTSLSLQVAVDSLRSLGMSERQIEELKRSRQADSQISIFSPIDGFVLARSISPEQRFDKGTEIYRIADISHVWVMTDIFEKDREFLKPGALATVYYQGREFPARMSEALPQFDPQSRTLKTRFELDNPGLILRPDMFVDVDLRVNMPEAITVPADAIVDSGRRRAVFVECADDGSFEPRIVETGWRLGDRVQITKGLAPGERIVVSGNFLVDSESRMKLAGAGSVSAAERTAPILDPVCGMEVDPKAPHTPTVRLGGKTYYFCSEKCRKDFEASPGKYVREMAALDGNRARDSR